MGKNNLEHRVCALEASVGDLCAEVDERNGRVDGRLVVLRNSLLDVVVVLRHDLLADVSKLEARVTALERQASDES